MARAVECKQRLQAATLTAEKAAALAEAASGLWAARWRSSVTGCRCLEKLQAGSQVRRCTKSGSCACAALQLSDLLLPASAGQKIAVVASKVIWFVVLVAAWIVLVFLVATAVAYSQAGSSYGTF